jgi:hypothetical protein
MILIHENRDIINSFCMKEQKATKSAPKPVFFCPPFPLSLLIMTYMSFGDDADSLEKYKVSGLPGI